MIDLIQTITLVVLALGLLIHYIAIRTLQEHTEFLENEIRRLRSEVLG